MEARLDHLTSVILELTRNMNHSPRSIRMNQTDTQSEPEVPAPKMIIKSEKEVNRPQTLPVISVQQFKKFHNLIIKKISNLERELHKNHLVIFGLDAIDAEAAVGHLINVGLNIPCHRTEIQHCYYIGKRKNRLRPIRVLFVRYKLCQAVFNRRHLVSQTGIRIYHDMPFEVRKQRAILRKYIEDNKVNGTLNYDKLMVNGIAHTVESLGLGDDREIPVKASDTTFDILTVSNRLEQNSLDQNVTTVDETFDLTVEAAVSSPIGIQPADIIREDSPDVEVLEDVKRFRIDPDIIDLDSICSEIDDPDIIILD